MNRCMDQNDGGVDLMQTLLRGFTAMRRAVVYDPKQPFTGTIWFFSQHLLDQATKWCNTRLRLTSPHYMSPTHVPRGQILQRTAAPVFVFNIGRSPRCGRQGGIAAKADLVAGLLVGAQNMVLGTQRLALPHARIEV